MKMNSKPTYSPLARGTEQKKRPEFLAPAGISEDNCWMQRVSKGVIVLLAGKSLSKII